jgi:hypothetical protein
MATHIKRPVSDKNAAFEKEARALLRGVIRRRKCSIREASRLLHIDHGYAARFLKGELGCNHAMRLAVMQARERKRIYGDRAYYFCDKKKFNGEPVTMDPQLLRMIIGNMDSFKNYLVRMLPKEN